MARNSNFSSENVRMREAVEGLTALDSLDRGALSERKRADQYGSPKWLGFGEPRACYGVLSYNTSQGNGGIIYLDKFFHPVKAFNGINNYVEQPQDHVHVSGSNTNQNYSQLFYGAASTASYPSSSGSSTYMNATPASGEFGNIGVDVFSNSTATGAGNRSSNHVNTKHQLNQSYINSNHSNQRLAYILYNGMIRAVDRTDGDFNYDAIGTLAVTITGLNTSMRGSASYNLSRKELIILTYVTAGVFDVMIFKGVDFDKYPSPHQALETGKYTLVTKRITLTPFPVANNESNYHPIPVLCDNGSIYLTVMFTSNTLALHLVARDVANDALTPSVITTRALTTSYGADQSYQYGQRAMQSRDGGAVICFCTYYYYGAGIQSFIIDRKKSKYLSSNVFAASDSNYGYSVVPYGDDGFAAYYCGNAYASNYTSAYVSGVVSRNGADELFQSSSTIYLPMFPYPNTTNYPALTQVADYSLLNNQSVKPY